MEMRKVCVINYKGGTGKTCTVINLAHGLAMKGKKVLIVDTDPQGSAGYHLGVEPKGTLYDVLIDGGENQIGDCIVHARENLDIIASNERLFPAEIALSKMPNRELVLQKKLAKLESMYDYVLVDCAPSICLLNQNALLYADEVFLPVSMEYLSLVGVKQLLNNLKIINRIFKHNIKVTKLIPTFFDKRNSKSKNVMGSLQRVFSQIVSSPIRTSVSISESAGYRQSVLEYNPDSIGASDYVKLVEEVLKDG